MIPKRIPPYARRPLLALATVCAVLAGLFGAAVPAQAATQAPCDIFSSGSTPCVAAYSMVRAMYGSYDGPLYRIERASDDTYLNVGLLAAGGYVNSAPQVSFCANTTCTVTELYDQSSEGNNLPVSIGGYWPGPGTNGADVENAVQADIVTADYTAPTTPFTPGARISVQATTACCTGDYIQHDASDTKVVIAPVTSASSTQDKGDATWIVTTGLADPPCISLESANETGEYLRHYGFELWLEPSDGSHQFAEDATFCPTPGNSGTGYSLQSINYPDHFIRHYDYTVYVAADGGSNAWDNPVSWSQDTTWLAAGPWS